MESVEGQNKEVWKPIFAYGLNGLYEASNLGRVRSIDTETTRGGRWGKERIYRKRGKVLSSFKSNNGYITFTVSIRNKNFKLLAHRLIASTFIENQSNKSQVNHINGNRADNRVENLEWMTGSENKSYRFTMRDRYCSKCRAKL